MNQTMDQQQLVILIVSIIVALLIGFLIGKSMGKSKSEGQVKAEEELQNYKDSVKDHFVKSADIVDDLTVQYKNLFEHLGKSAEDLLGKEDVQKILEERENKTVTLTYLKSDTTEEGSTEDKTNAAQIVKEAADTETTVKADNSINTEASEKETTTTDLDNTENKKEANTEETNDTEKPANIDAKKDEKVDTVNTEEKEKEPHKTTS